MWVHSTKLFIFTLKMVMAVLLYYHSLLLNLFFLGWLYSSDMISLSAGATGIKVGGGSNLRRR